MTRTHLSAGSLTSAFTSGLRDVQRRYRQASTSLVVPSADRQEANPGTVGTAADWLLRFMLHPQPSLKLAAAGAALCGRRSGLVDALARDCRVARLRSRRSVRHRSLRVHRAHWRQHTDPGQLISACWALALLTEMYRNPAVAMRGPLERFQSHHASAIELLGLAPGAALSQLAAFREVFASALLPKLVSRPGRWVLGPEFAGSALIKADADLITARLLIELKTSSKLSLGVTTIFQIVGYALLDFDDAYQLTEVGLFSARHAYLAIWDIGELLDELAGHNVSLPATRQAFRRLLLTHQLFTSCF